jgi:thiamine-phosphate pyrophosphorylase
MSLLYLISPAEFELEKFKRRLENALKSSDKIGAFQMRLKNQDLDDVRLAIKELLPICHEHGVPFFINDYYQLAREFPVDGIHVGQNDGDVLEIVKKYKGKKIIGVSCGNSVDLAIDAVEAGASYVSFGAFFETLTKENTKKAEISILDQWVKSTRIPCAAIGGIGESNIELIKNTGVDFICVVSGVWNGDEIEKVKKLSEKL